jgi:hypothetical protein
MSAAPARALLSNPALIRAVTGVPAAAAVAGAEVS